MISRNVWLTVAVAVSWLPNIVLAQMGMGLNPPESRFANAPGLGEPIPDVTIVDDQGNPANIRELARRSPYTVLTLGCLT